MAVLPERVPDPRSVVPSRKFTDQVGVPEAVTIAVKVTAFCHTDGIGNGHNRRLERRVPDNF